MSQLRFSWGSVLGADHLKVKKNCQDTYATRQTKDYFVAFVCDGGSNSNLGYETFTEVGARIGVNIVTNYVADRLNNISRWRWNAYLQSANFWGDVQTNLLKQVDGIARGMGGHYRRNVVDYFLFTLVGMVITPDITLFTGIGDGYFFLNGEKYEVHSSGSDNMPVYIAYNLVETNLKKMSPEDLKLGVKKIVPSATVNSVMIASDGLTPLIVNDEKTEEDETRRMDVGSIEQFWNEKGYFDNTFSLGWRLKQLATEKKIIKWDEKRAEIHPAIITDDLALVVASRI
jgi:Protein phosphatase 2C